MMPFVVSAQGHLGDGGGLGNGRDTGRSSHCEEREAGQISELSGLVAEPMAHKIRTFKECDYYWCGPGRST